MRIEISHRVGVAPERVFAVLADPAQRPGWQENTHDVELLSDGPIGLGSRWRETQRGVGRVEFEVAAFAPATLWAEAGTAGAGGGRVTVSLSEDGPGATRVDVTVELKLRGARRMMGRALAPVVRRQVPRDLDRLEALIRAG